MLQESAPCLIEKGVKYNSKFVDLMKFEPTEDYKKLNPNAVVPTIVHDGTAIHRIHCDINQYIDEASRGAITKFFERRGEQSTNACLDKAKTM